MYETLLISIFTISTGAFLPSTVPGNERSETKWLYVSQILNPANVSNWLKQPRLAFFKPCFFRCLGCKFPIHPPFVKHRAFVTAVKLGWLPSPGIHPSKGTRKPRRQKQGRKNFSKKATPPTFQTIDFSSPWRIHGNGMLTEKWMFPKMVGFPNNHGWNPTKNDHFGVFWGYPYFRKHPHENHTL